MSTVFLMTSFLNKIFSLCDGQQISEPRQVRFVCKSVFLQPVPDAYFHGGEMNSLHILFEHHIEICLHMVFSFNFQSVSLWCHFFVSDNQDLPRCISVSFLFYKIDSF